MKNASASYGVDPRFSAATQIDTGALVRLRELACHISLRQPRKVYSALSGQHVSAIRGRGLEYAEVRHYQPGDDIRAMDWRVTARTGQPHIKVFQEELERPLLLVCDLRASMHFGSRRTFKQVLAADLCALLAWAGANSGDRVGALIFNDDQQFDLRPSNGPRHVLQIINRLAAMPTSAASEPVQRMTAICQQLRRVSRPGTAIWFISDWSGFGDEQQALLFDLCRHCEITAIQVHDRLESELPPPGRYDITDGQQRLRLDTASSQQRLHWQQLANERQQQLQQQLTRLKVPLLRIATDDDPLTILRQGGKA
ncbi:DUF58 domain-containing protein [Parathalassolituus penaei]|uniref:DUF58 domain-containing protein n=1 Tax=Parathalassolituus penaei TaxID=2997323 RepID=A0A9X3IT41_9GAMM|nr:DUF58 domain-containing protein [Parathalassolituus penaei]MCY0966501.1 DUF58 domain-containing protein [Parathalassolituus penaei]